jgi:hypothetical protein
MIGRTDDGRLPTLRRVFYALFAPHGLLSRTLFKGQAAVDATAKLFKRKTSNRSCVTRLHDRDVNGGYKMYQMTA